MAGSVRAHQQETHHERVDRELIELLNELRVALPGVQVLFAFLLTVPFTQRFGRTTEIERDIYFVTLILAGLSTAFLIAPSSQHRLLFRKKDKEQLLFRSNRYAIVGFICLGAALCSAVLLVAAFLFSSLVAVLASAMLGAVMIWLWIALPLRRRFVEKDERVTAD